MIWFIIGFICFGGVSVFALCMFAMIFEDHKANQPVFRCDICGNEIENPGTCQACESFLDHLKYCEKHDIMYDGIDCPRCKYGAFAQFR